MDLRQLTLGILMACLLVLAPAALAQTDSTTDPTIIGDTNSEALQVVQNYVQNRDASLIAEDATFNDPTLVSPVQGRDAIDGLQTDDYGQAFWSSLHPQRYVVADDTVYVEYGYTDQFERDLTGDTNVSDPQTDTTAADADADQNVPVIGTYEVEDGQIIRINLYYDPARVRNQIGLSTAPETVVVNAVSSPVEVVTVDDITDDFDAYNDLTLAVEGTVGRALGENAFILYEEDLINDDRMIVFDASEDGLDFVQLGGAYVLVSGVVRDYNLAEIENETGFDYEDELFIGYEELPVMMATSALNLGDVSTINNILDNPQAFLGQYVSVTGAVGEALTDRGFLLRDQDLIDLDQEVLPVFDGTTDGFDFIQLPDAEVFAAGTLRTFALADFENEYGLDLDDNAYADWEGNPVLVADAVFNRYDVSTIDNITDFPDAFLGQYVTVEGTIDEAIGVRGFVISDDDLFANERLLVIGQNQSALSMLPTIDEDVLVSGVVREFDIADLEMEYGFDLDDTLYNDWADDEPVLLTDFVWQVE